MPRFDMSPEELRGYAPHIAAPEDFDSFWEQTLADNPFDPSGVRVEKAATPLRTLDVYDVTFPGYGGHPIRAWLTIPAGSSGPLPTIVQFNGYGGGRGLPVDHLDWASAGYAHLFMDTRGQGGTWGNGGSTGDPGASGSADQGFMTRGIEDPRDHYYRRLYVDAHHCVEAAASLDVVDEARIGVQGISQGGALTIAAAALNPRVAAAMPDVPFMCHIDRAVTISAATPYEEVVRYLHVFRDREELVLGTLSYFDCALLARRACAPALFSTALLDTTCPPSTVFAARNAWGANAPEVGACARPSADIEVYPYNEHEGGEAYQWLRQIAWLDALGLGADAPTAGGAR
ncbi:acetylxylan esterase [Schaalia vaccimaxillae]|uniref:acetylxylan esterase n=1 Tax=Schaalia vaccimaxillae TaxID=183916 RepID=UPI000409957F|nr:acetylxylan esterase [Schaalia vaccimaxillae]